MLNYLLAVILFVGFLFFLNKGLSSSGFKIAKIWPWPPFAEYSVNQQNTNNTELKNNQEVKKPEDKFRGLEPLETGKNIDDLPDYVYGYEHAIDIQYYIKFISEKSNTFSINLSNRKNEDFEMQRVGGKNYLLGFVNSENYSKKGETSEFNPLNLILFPRPWKDMDKLVSVPFNSIIDINYRMVDVENNKSYSILEIKTSELITDAFVHF